MTEDERLERLCEAVIAAGLATGHADTIEDLMTEVLDQAKHAMHSATPPMRTLLRGRPFITVGPPVHLMARLSGAELVQDLQRMGFTREEHAEHLDGIQLGLMYTVVQDPLRHVLAVHGTPQLLLSYESPGRGA